MMTLISKLNRKEATRFCEFCNSELLTLHGMFHAEKFPELQNTPCECECEGARHERAQADQKAREDAILCKQKQEAQAVEASGMPQGWIYRNLEQYQPSNEGEAEALISARQFVQRAAVGRLPRKGLFVIGGVGVGKTHLVSSLARSLQNAGIRITWRNMGDVLLDFRATYKQKAKQSEEELVSFYTSMKYLFLDDLGKEKITEWAQALIFTIINKRTDKGLPTIITANYGRENLEKRLTPQDGDEMTARAIVDRIIGSSVTHVIRGESKRKVTT